jgi:hypothetical protein
MVGRTLRVFGRCTRLVGRGAPLIVVALLAVAAGALAAAHLKPGALYTGESPLCKAVVNPGPGLSCTFRFHASQDGRSLHPFGESVISSWGCHGGGGEALLGGSAKGHDLIPVLSVDSNGAVRGSAGHGSSKVTVSGHLANAGKAADITFHLVNQGCVSPRVTITAH